MLTSARNAVAIVASVAIVGAGFASVVGQVRQRRRPRAQYETTLPTPIPSWRERYLGVLKRR